MATRDEIADSWSTTNIHAVKEAEYQAYLATLPPRARRRKDKEVRRADWRMAHRRLPGFLAAVLVH